MLPNAKQITVQEFVKGRHWIFLPVPFVRWNNIQKKEKLAYQIIGDVLIIRRVQP